MATVRISTHLHLYILAGVRAQEAKSTIYIATVEEELSALETLVVALQELPEARAYLQKML